ncbi:MAG TPA: SusC/RagA family TonB-linked outer membrane protein [Chryseolinea sp.]|nr:SusC/RagA family TonB-linked outer membrane protein [Chryseolinea sp.]
MKSSLFHAPRSPHRPAVRLAWPILERRLPQFMRIVILVLILIASAIPRLFATHSKGQRLDSVQVTLELKGESLERALKQIEKRTSYRFMYRNQEVKKVTGLTLESGTRSLANTLTLLLENTTLTYREMNEMILIERVGTGVSSAVSQSVTEALPAFTVTGTVTSTSANEPLPGVSIVVKGTQTGTMTDADGKYTLDTETGSATLVYSFIGFQTVEAEVGQRNVVDVAMEPDITQLDEVVVTSFGIEQQKQSIGYSAQKVDGSSLIQMRQTNVVNALQGQVAGVQITSSGGAPGMSSRILVRGITSLDPTANNQPLFVVDGIPIDNSTYETASGATENTPRGLSNRAMDINPNDIESLTVLKGAAATALYGVRAANGAIVISTKKGIAGQLQINASSTFGMDQINKYPSFQDKYGQGSNGQYNPEDIFPAWGAPISVANVVDPEYRYYDNVKNAMQTGKTFDNHISVSGGNKIATFYAAVGNTDQQGVIPYSTWKRTVAKVSGSLNFNDKFTATVSMNYTNSGGNRVPHDRFMENLMYYPVTRDVRNFEDEDGYQNYQGLSDNPLYTAKYSKYEDRVDRVLGNILLSYKPVEWFSLNYRLGTDFYSDYRQEIAPGPRSATDEFPISATGYIEDTQINSRILNSNVFAEFKKGFGTDFTATLRLGQELFQEDRRSSIVTGQEFEIPQFFAFSNAKQLLYYQELRKRRLIGAYGDLMLNYKDWLYLNITGRNDWTSTLPKGNNSFFYPSYNLSFIFSEIANLPEQISFGKLRASYGEVGKDTDPYLTSTVYANSLGFPINGQLGFTRDDVRGSNDLRPERTTTIDLGAELKFFENRLGIEFAWYKSNSRDQIFRVPVSEAAGYPTIVTNVGEIENKGIELVLTGNPVRTTNFRWDVLVNFTRNRNRVADIAEGLDEFPISTQFGYSGSTVTMKLKEGDAYGNIYGTSYQRYYEGDTPENLRYLDHGLPLVIGANGFPVRNTDQLVLGNAQPKWLGGIRNTLTYHGVTLSFLIDARWGIDQYDQFHNFLSAFGKLYYSENRNDMVVFDGVMADGTPNTKEVFMGQALGPDGVDYGQGFYRVYFRTTSENFVRNASFVKLRNVSLSYSLPKTWLQKTPFKAIGVSATVNNIILWTPWINFDPESFSGGAGGNATGFTGLTYPSHHEHFVHA